MAALTEANLMGRMMMVMNAQRVGPEWRKIRWYDRMSRRVIASNLRKLQVLAFSKLPLMS